MSVVRFWQFVTCTLRLVPRRPASENTLTYCNLRCLVCQSTFGHAGRVDHHNAVVVEKQSCHLAKRRWSYQCRRELRVQRATRSCHFVLPGTRERLVLRFFSSSGTRPPPKRRWSEVQAQHLPSMGGNGFDDGMFGVVVLLHQFLSHSQPPPPTT